MARISLRRMNYGSNYERDRVEDFHIVKPFLIMSPLYPFLGVAILFNPPFALSLIIVFIAYKLVYGKKKGDK